MSVDGPNSNHIPQKYDPYESLVARTQQRHRLLAVHWELTYRCNERCTHCYLDVLPPAAAPVGELTTAECYRVLDELAGEGALNISFSGGEIFVRKDWHAILSYARARGFAIRIYTNATLVTPAVADQIQALHPFMVEVSLYGVDPATHEGITRLPNSYAHTLRGLRLLKDRKVKTTIKTPLLRENVYQYFEFQALAREYGAVWHQDQTLTPKDSGRKTNLGHRITDEQMLWLYQQTIEPGSFPWSAGNPEARTCGITQNSLSLDPYGEVYPCVQTRVSAGNVRDRPVHAIWNEAPVWSDLGNLTLGELPICSTCELRTICVRCHGIAKLESGDLRAPALANCREALLKRQAMIAKGMLPADYPIPAHLQNYQPEPTFLPLSAVQTRVRSAARQPIPSSAAT